MQSNCVFPIKHIRPPPQPGPSPAAAFHCCPLSFDIPRGYAVKVEFLGIQLEVGGIKSGSLGPSRSFGVSSRAATRTFYRSATKGVGGCRLCTQPPALLPEVRERWWGWGPRVGHLERLRHPHCSLPQPEARPQQPTPCFPGLLLQHQDEQ